MAIDIKKQLKREPQIYSGVDFYPILLSDIDMYDLFSEIMCIPKEYIPIKEVLKMSYLKYLCFFLQGYASFEQSCDQSNISFKDKLQILLEHITRQNVTINQIIDDVLDDDIKFHYELYIGKIKFYEYDFDKIRELILEQNGKNLNYIESFNPDLEISLHAFNNSKGGLTITDRLFIYSAISHVDIDDMLKWTIPEFEKKEEILRTYEEWKIYRPLECSGKIEIKAPNRINSPFEYEDKKRDNRYSSIMIELDDFNKDLKQFAK